MKSFSVISLFQRLFTILLFNFIISPAYSEVFDTNSKATASSINLQDSMALVALYNSTDGANWTFNTNWLSGPIAKWHGITVKDNRVTEIKLFNNNLNGTIPKEMGNLTGLINLYLYSNTLSGSIPVEIGQLTNLVNLHLYANRLSGNIPPELSQLTSLKQLFLYSNQFSGSIPPELGQLINLEYLYLHGNALTSTIPAQLGNLLKLRYLYLYSNQLEGKIPPEIGKMAELYILNISNNKLSGQLPSGLGQLTKLGYLYAQFNKFSETIPKELGQLSSLYRIYLNNNNLSGTIPAEIGQLSRLQYLWLFNNQLNGNIPNELGQLSNLISLDVTINNLSDTIPSSIGQLKSLVELKASTNQLSGTIPNTLGQLTNLKLLELDRNELNGAIPRELNQLKNLETLSLTSNQFDGFLCDSLTNLTNLSSIFVYYNYLTFEDLEDKIALKDKYFYYSPQNKIGQNAVVQLDTGVNYTLDINCGGTQNKYQWYFNGIPIGQLNDKSTYKINDITFDDFGTYYCLVTNDLVDGLTLKTATIQLEFLPEGKLAPTDIYISNNKIDENLPVFSDIGVLSSEDEDLYDTHIYSFEAGDGDTHNSSFIIKEDHLYSFEIFDFEKQSSYSIRIKTSDKQGNSFSKSFEILINDKVELPPSDIILSNNTIDENIEIGSFIGDLSTESNNIDGIFKYSLVIGDGDDDNASFLISGNQLLSKRIFNFENKNQYTLRVQTKDKDGMTFSKSFTILINDMTEQEPTDISLSNNSINENQDIGTFIGTFFTESTNLFGVFNYSFVAGEGDLNNSSFFISNDQIFSKTVFNFEEKDSFNIRVQTKDIEGLSFSKSFTIKINDLEEGAPTDIYLSSTSINENNPVGSTVAKISSESSNTTNTFTYTLVPGEGDIHNTNFFIVGDQLISRTVFDFEFKSDYSIRLQTMDSQGETFSKSFNILINDVDENNDLLIPDAFSPNGDGKNDYFEIKGIAYYPDVSIEIYNRYGHLVFNQQHYGKITDDSKSRWWDGYMQVNGIRSNERLPQGTYFMILTIDANNIYKKSIFLKD